ncbi:trafficking protein particle complex subunit 6A isoform X2 [Marmota marmota marmota]|nr:trafficking protein particle complex subunit 6A isoform X2 [Marmota marmota marmota]
MQCCLNFCTPRWWRSCGLPTPTQARGDRRHARLSWRAWGSAWARLWVRASAWAPACPALPCPALPSPALQAAPRHSGLQGGAGCPQVPVQRPVGGRVPKADGWPSHQSPGDLCLARQQLPPPRPDGLRPAVSGGSPQVPGLHLRPSVWRPPYPGLPEPGHRLRGSPARL